MLKFKRGLRLRIALAFAIFCILVVGTLGISLYVASGDIEEAHIDQVIEMEMEHLIERYRQQPNFIPQAGSNLEEYILPERSDELRLPSYLKGLNQRRHTVFHGPQEVRVAVSHVDGVKFLVAYEIGLHEQRKHDFGLLIGLSLLSLIVVALVVGYLLAGLLVREVADLAEQVRKLAPGNVQGVTLTQPGMDAEVAQLANALDDYQNRIRRMLQREQEFTANVSHEMRTPITTILTSCELLATEPNMPEKVRTRIGMIESAATRMGEQLQALLFLAREQALGVTELVSIAECVYDAAEHLRPEIARKQLDFEVDVELDAVLTLNRQALQTALVNLLRNAVQ
ncbi:MAG: HAMP domain-containing histidine kinase, partial [Nitrosospira sp.]|nr:HAMP domain-containing histidine kinase [Nitrosospira sp.]